MKQARDLVKEVTLLAEELAPSIKLDEVLASQDFHSYADALIEGITERYGQRKMELKLYPGNKEDTFIAATDNRKITVNTKNLLRYQYRDIYAQFMVILGLVFHECSHVVFLDFDAEARLMNVVKSGKFPAKPPVPANDSERQDLAELTQALADPKYGGLWEYIYHSLSNIIADCNNEHRMVASYGALIQDGIKIQREVDKRISTSFEKMVEDPHMSNLTIAFSLILDWAAFGSFIAEDMEGALANDEHCHVLRRCRSDIERAVATNDPDEKFSSINQIVLALWPTIRETIENMRQNSQGNGQSQSQQGNGQQNGQPKQGGSSSQSGQGQQGNNQKKGQSQQSGGNSSKSGQNQQNGQDQQQGGSSSQNGQGQQDSQSQQGSDSSQDGQQGDGTSPQSGLPQQQSGGTQQGGGSAPQPTKEQLENLLNALAEAIKNSGMTQAPTNMRSSDAAKEASKEAKEQDEENNENGESSDKSGAKTKKAEDGEESEDPSSDANGDKSKDADGDDSKDKEADSNASDPSGSSSDPDLEAAKNLLSQLIQSIAEEKAAKQIDKDLAKELLVRIKEIDRGSSHEGIPLHAERPNATNVEEYERIYETVREYSQNLQRKMKEILKDLRKGSVTKHRIYGEKVMASDAYRPDQRWFATRRLPTELPKMAVAVLVDNSGSMEGPRILAAKRAAILLHDFCRGLGIPCHVAGHCTTWNGVEYSVFADYDAVGKYDAYRIAAMKAGGCNRDGMAIEICEGLLSKRPEEFKLFIIISDGQPNDDGYGGEPARRDIQSIVSKYSHRGIVTYAAAIGDDKDLIERIYGDSFVDISDLSALPKTLVGLVKKNIMKHLPY